MGDTADEKGLCGVLNKRRTLICMGALLSFLLMAKVGWAAPLIPNIDINVGSSNNPQDVAVTLQILAVLTILSIAPSILLMTTAFVRIVVVIGFLRNALSTQNVPPNQVVIALALFLTVYIMGPYWSVANEQGLQPYLAGQISQEEALKNVVAPMREFMFKQTREADLALFVNLVGDARPDTQDDVSTFTLIPAYVISELKTAFQISCSLSGIPAILMVSNHSRISLSVPSHI